MPYPCMTCRSASESTGLPWAQILGDLLILHAAQSRKTGQSRELGLQASTVNLNSAHVPAAVPGLRLGSMEVVVGWTEALSA